MKVVLYKRGVMKVVLYKRGVIKVMYKNGVI